MHVAVHVNKPPTSAIVSCQHVDGIVSLALPLLLSQSDLCHAFASAFA